MGFIESVNKIGVKIQVEDTPLYKDILSSKAIFKNKGLDIVIKDEFDLFQYEVVYRSLLNFVHIENNIEIFTNMNLDILNIVSYVEKQRLFNHDANIFLKDIPCFYHIDSKTLIYIPIFEPIINHKYINEYQAILLKKYRLIVNEKNLKVTTPIDLYGLNIFRTHFTSLHITYEDYRHICLYSDDLKTIYIFDKKRRLLLNKMIVCDKYYKGHIDINEIMKMNECIENYEYQKCLDIMYANHYITINSYNSVNKRLK